MTTKFAGLEGFVWWFGKVIDRDDPYRLGRVLVRITNFHEDIPTSDLPWVPIVMDPTNASLKISSSGDPASRKGYEVGWSPNGLLVDSLVFGFFADGANAQYPIILGSLHGIPDYDLNKHDVSPLSRTPKSPVFKGNVIPRTFKGFNTLEKKPAPFPLGPEPPSPYAAQYPYNKVYTTERGHTFEIDDTPGEERILFFHRVGNYIEIDKNGTQVEKSMGDRVQIMVKDNIVYIKGNQNIRVIGNVDISVDGHYYVTSKKHIKLVAPRIDFNP